MNKGRRAAALVLLLSAGCAAAQDESLDALLTAQDAEATAPEAAPALDVIELADEPAAAPEARPPPRRTIEEIVVTAQKREQGLSEVPISISAFDAEFLADAAITDFRDLSIFVPNARIDANGTLPQLSIRGFNAHPLNRAFEQAISLVVDGVTYGTSPFFQLPLYDIGRVEVLRGPQGTLFGKNSTAGAFNIATRAADSDELEGHLSVQGGELERRRVELGVGGPLGSFGYWRIAGLYDERDGLLDNTTDETVPTANPRINGRDRRAARLKLAFADLGGFDLRLAAETVDVSLTGFGAELFLVAPQSVPLYRLFDANFDDLPNNYVGSIDADEYTDIAGEIYTLELTRALGEWDTTLIAGHADLLFDNIADPDFGPAPALTLIQKDRHPQSTIELRTSSPELDGLFGFGDTGTSNLTVGAFWQNRRFTDSEAGLRIDPTATLIFLAGDTLPLPIPLPQPGGVLPPNNPADDEVGIIYYDQITRSAALFGQFEWSPTPAWMLQLGLRYSDEQKEASWNSVSVQGTGLLARLALGREPYTADADRSEQQLSPKALVRYIFSDDASLYLAWVRAFRAGGFNQIASTGDPDGLQHDEEQVRSWEGGGKFTLLDGAAQLNVGLFWMNLSDFQVVTQDPSDVGFTVLNAGEAQARGVEIDGLWLVNDWLSLQGSLGFNDNEFLNFPFGTCAAGNEDTDGDGDERCDISGEPLDFASRFTATLSPRAEFTLPWQSLALDLGVVAAYQSSYFADNALRDERVKQDGVTRWNAYVGIASADGRWRLRIVGENLTDEVVASYKSDVPLATDTFYQTLEPGRLIFGEFSWRF
ncbi:TonB-dependent receptor [Sinimarinibacterium thermocellulolyticum]|uniref:TonB-dependent receptor n=1 Tax=Sinimarinibacterium thermocellulolyticum TaxID=3170016 RepID=A0ABV2AEK6_9GAMM